jgi:hypothetical protein
VCVCVCVVCVCCVCVGERERGRHVYLSTLSRIVRSDQADIKEEVAPIFIITRLDSVTPSMAQ